LIVIDTLSRALGALSENDASAMNQYEDLSRALMELFECSCYTIAHTGKDEGKRLRGSNAAEGNFDAIAQYAQTKTRAGSIYCVFTLTDRGSNAEPIAVTLQKTVWGETVMWKADDAPATSKAEGEWRLFETTVAEAIRELFDGIALAASDVAEQVIATCGEGAFNGRAAIIRRMNDNAKGRLAKYVSQPRSHVPGKTTARGWKPADPPSEDERTNFHGEDEPGKGRLN
jgi:hypothetical protein